MKQFDFAKRIETPDKHTEGALRHIRGRGGGLVENRHLRSQNYQNKYQLESVIPKKYLTNTWARVVSVAAKAQYWSSCNY